MFRSLANFTKLIRNPAGARPRGVAQADTQAIAPKPLLADLEANSVILEDNIELYGEICGTGNIIHIERARSPQKLFVSIHGNDNQVTVGQHARLSGLRVDIGSRQWSCSQVRLRIGKSFSIGSGGRFILPNSGNVVEIGDHCMFSNSITLRGGEYPHLIFDIEGGDYLDVSDGIFIGGHVWVGEGAYIAKAVTIPPQCIVGARGVVTKRFDVENAVIAGNPARIVKKGVQWLANERGLSDHPELRAGFDRTPIKQINDGYQSVPTLGHMSRHAEEEGDDVKEWGGARPRFVQFD